MLAVGQDASPYWATNPIQPPLPSKRQHTLSSPSLQHTPLSQRVKVFRQGDRAILALTTLQAAYHHGRRCYNSQSLAQGQSVERRFLTPSTCHPKLQATKARTLAVLDVTRRSSQENMYHQRQPPGDRPPESRLLERRAAPEVPIFARYRSGRSCGFPFCFKKSASTGPLALVYD